MDKIVGFFKWVFCLKKPNGSDPIGSIPANPAMHSLLIHQLNAKTTGIKRGKSKISKITSKSMII